MKDCTRTDLNTYAPSGGPTNTNGKELEQNILDTWGNNVPSVREVFAGASIPQDDGSVAIRSKLVTETKETINCDNTTENVDSVGVVIEGQTKPVKVCSDVNTLSLNVTRVSTLTETTVAPGYKSLEVKAVSGDVTVAGASIPQGESIKVTSDYNESFSTSVAVNGTDYLITEVR